VDQNRLPGRFILTGSANVLLLPQLADSLAGRIEIIQLRPLAQSEIAGQNPTFMQQLFAGDFRQNNSSAAKQHCLVSLGESLAELICMGGYPAAITRTSERRRSIWYRDYISTIVQRDIQDIARIRNLDILPKLLNLAASQTAHLFNSA